MVEMLMGKQRDAVGAVEEQDLPIITNKNMHAIQENYSLET